MDIHPVVTPWGWERRRQGGRLECARSEIHDDAAARSTRVTTTIRTTATSTETFTRTHAYDGNGRPSARLAAHAAHARVEKTRVGPALAADQDAGRARSGFTGHEPLDRTGFVHMNGRLYDPAGGPVHEPRPGGLAVVVGGTE